MPFFANSGGKAILFFNYLILYILIMDSSTGSEDLDRLKERLKINFFQVEKRLAEDDIRMGNLEKDLKSLGDFKKAAENLGKEPPSIEALRKQFQEISTELKGLKTAVDNNKVCFEELDRLFSQLSKNVGAGKTEADPKIISEIKSLKLAVEENRTELGKLNGLFSEMSKVWGMKQLPDLGEVLKQVKVDTRELEVVRNELINDRNMYRELRSAALASIEKIENLEKQFTKDLSEFGDISKQMGDLRKRDEELSLNIKSEISTLRGSVENLEHNLNESVEGLENNLRNSVEGLEHNIKDLVRDEITRLEAEGMKLEKSVADSGEQMKEELKTEMIKFENKMSSLDYFLGDSVRDLQEEIRFREEQMDGRAREMEKSVSDFKTAILKDTDERFGILKDDLGTYADHKFEKQAQVINVFGGEMNRLKEDFSHLKKDIVEKTIDEEMNKLLIILSEKLKGLVTRDDFEKIDSNIKSRLDALRSPDIKPLDEKIGYLEGDVAELKRLLRGLSQRLPVIVE